MKRLIILTLSTLAVLALPNGTNLQNPAFVARLKTTAPASNEFILQEGGGHIMKEGLDGALLKEFDTGYLQLEGGGYILQEGGGKLVI